MIAHRSAEDMARSLVTYMADCHAIRKAILSDFKTSPSVASIAGLRGSFLRQKARMQRGKKDGSKGACEQGAMTLGHDVHAETAKAADALLEALWREHPRILEHLGAQK